MKRLLKTSYLNELNGEDLRDFYMRSIFQLSKFKRLFQELRNHEADSIHDFKIDFSILEDQKINNDKMMDV